MFKVFTELPSPIAALAALVLPSLCAACGAPRLGFGGGGACRPCWDSLPGPDPRACPLCALPLPAADGGTAPCPSCRREAPPVEASFAAGPYSGTLKKLVHAFKFEGFDLLAPGLSRLMAEAVGGRGGAASAGIGRDTVVCAVPSTRARNRERGYDPGPLLGLGAARRLELPYRTLLARRPPRAGAPQLAQSSLPAGERRRNVAGAFLARPRARGLALLLVDDVLTTGATAFEAAATLRSAGAASVRLLVLARTPLPHTTLPEPA